MKQPNRKKNVKTMDKIKEADVKIISIKSLRNYFIYAIVGCLAMTFLSSFATIYTFYYQTNRNIENLNSSDLEQNTNIEKINVNLNEINKIITNTTTITAVSDEKIGGLEKNISKIQVDVVDMQKTQIDILKILGEIKRRQ